MSSTEFANSALPRKLPGQLTNRTEAGQIITEDVELLEQDLPGLPSQIRRPWRRSEGRSSWWTSLTTSSPGLGRWSTYGPWWSPGWPEAQQHYVGTLHCQLVLIICAGGNRWKYFVKTNSKIPENLVEDSHYLCILNNLPILYYTVHAIGFNSSWDHTKEIKTTDWIIFPFYF